MKKIIIIGAGGHAAELVEYVKYSNIVGKHHLFEIIGLLDDNEDNYNHYKYREKYLGKISEHNVQNEYEYLIGVANLEYRRKIVEKFIEKGAKFIKFIHPTALIASTADIGEGTVISHNVSVGPMVKVGRFNILNSRCTIGHDSSIGDFNFISPQVAISGNTFIGNENMIGTNACTIPGMKIGNKNKIAAGMVIYKNVGDNETVLFRHSEKIIIKENIT